mgnify:CR=1 FL=1
MERGRNLVDGCDLGSLHAYTHMRPFIVVEAYNTFQDRRAFLPRFFNSFTYAILQY